MRTKATFLAGFATGYVLGSRAGRARYEQIRRAAQAFAANPTVQKGTNQLQHQAGDVLHTAKDKASSALGERLAEKKPSWLGSGSSSGGDTGDYGPAGDYGSSRSAGSNGAVGG